MNVGSAQTLTATAAGTLNYNPAVAQVALDVLPVINGAPPTGHGREGLTIDLVSVRTADVVGDFNHNGLLDVTDLEMLGVQLRSMPTERNYDLNNDVVLTNEDRARWVHDLANTYFGDANLDGEFNSADLTAIFQAGEYEDDIPLNSTWEEGDWNGDGEFDSGDLVEAFKDGGYEKGPRIDTHAVPEPSSLILLGLSLFAIVHHRKLGSSRFAGTDRITRESS